METKKLYLSAPLPFVGQKRNFARPFIKVLEQYPDGTTFVDLFGGSGLLSHIAKHQKPHSKVVYNDYDNYRERLVRIPETNELLAKLREITAGIPRKSPIMGEARERVLANIADHEARYGWVDYITLSPSILFSMKYLLSLDAIRKEGLYNKIRTTDFAPAGDYLEGLTVTSADYREVFAQYKDEPNVVFLVDPPYLSTEAGTYRMYWKLSDYLDVLNVLRDHRFIYFTSNKSSILELCQWLGKNRDLGNPFAGCQMVEFHAQMNYNASYTDMMIYNAA
ncbi:MAG: DNA adenine methylase [Muribaculaceae bacterium]|nr:DNA adenine methylase [Muribaculaceae bacterium]